MWGCSCVCGRQREFKEYSTGNGSTLAVGGRHAFGEAPPGWCDLITTCAGPRIDSRIDSRRQPCRQLRQLQITSCDIDRNTFDSVCSQEAADLKAALQETQEKLENATRELAVVAGLSVEEAQEYLEKSASVPCKHIALHSTMKNCQNTVVVLHDPVDKENVMPSHNFTALVPSSPENHIAKTTEHPASPQPSQTSSSPGSAMNSPDRDLARLRIGHWEYPMSRDEKKFLALRADQEVSASLCRELTQVRQEKKELNEVAASVTRELTQVRQEKDELTYKLASIRAALR